MHPTDQQDMQLITHRIAGVGLKDGKPAESDS